MQQFERSIREIGALYQDTSSRISTTSDPSIRRSIEMQANGQLLILVRDAESIEPFIRKEITAPDYVVLGNTELQLLHYQDAIKYLRLASERETDTSTHAEILRFLGQAYAMLNTPGGLKKARMAFRQSEALMESFTGYNVAFQRANLIASEIYVEAYFGDCSRLPDLTKRLLGEIDAPGVSLESMRALRLTLARSLEGQSRCQWDRAAIVPAP